MQTGQEPTVPKTVLSDNIRDARRDVLEARQALAKRPSYMAALKVQILKRHYDRIRTPRIVVA